MRDAASHETSLESAPIIVGGTGGSGTRALVAFLRGCDVAMGSETNGVGDALSFVDLLDAHLNRIIALTKRIDYCVDQLDPGLRTMIVADLRAAASQHRIEAALQARWGFKNPRQMFLLPLLDAAFPSAIFIHLVRDGRDMLLSENRNQARKHFESLFGVPFDRSDEHVALFWAKTNLEAHAYGSKHLGSRYVDVRIEDLCGANRARHVGKLATVLGLDPGKAQHQASVFRTQDSFGRGGFHEGEISPATREVFRAALDKFGYLS
ncbi:MAG: sulfotransferase [Rhizomicrobium sp.]